LVVDAVVLDAFDHVLVELSLELWPLASVVEVNGGAFSTPLISVGIPQRDLDARIAWLAGRTIRCLGRIGQRVQLIGPSLGAAALTQERARLTHGLRSRKGRAAVVSPSGVIFWAVPGSPLSLIEFPADDPARARRFWAELLGVELEARQDGEGEGWQTHSGAPAVGVHARGRGPGDSVSLPYFAVSDVAEALERVEALGGSVVHPGEAWAICKDSEGSPFGLAQESLGA